MKRTHDLVGESVPLPCSKRKKEEEQEGRIVYIARGGYPHIKGILKENIGGE